MKNSFFKTLTGYRYGILLLILVGTTPLVSAQAPQAADCYKELLQKGMLQLEAKNYLDALDYFDLAIKCYGKLPAENEPELKKWQTTARDGIITDLAEARAATTKQQRLADSLQLLREKALHSNQNIAASTGSDLEGIKTLALWRALTQDPSNKALEALWQQQAEKAVDVYFREEQLFPHSDEIKKTLFSEKGDRLATLSADDKLWIWDFNTGVLLSKVAAISNIYLSKDKNTLIAIGGRAVFAYNLDDGLLLSKQVLQNSISSPIFEKDLILTKNKALILKVAENQIIIWNWKKSNFVEIQTPQKIIKMQCSKDQQNLFCLFGDGSLQYWKIFDSSPKEIELPADKSAVNSFDLSKEQVIFSGLNVLHFYSLKNKQIVASHTFKSSIIQAFCLNDSFVISSHEDGVLKLWDSHNGQLVSSLAPNNYKKYNKNHIYSTSIQYVNPKYKKTQNRSRIKQLIVSKDRKKIAVIYLDGKAKLWNIAEKNSSIDLKYVHVADAIPENRPKEEKFWTNTELPSSLKMSPTDISHLCFSDDGRYLLALHSNSSITVWDAVEAVHIHTFYDPYEGEKHPITNVGFGPNNKGILAYSNNKELLYWFIDKKGKIAQKLGTATKFMIDPIYQNTVLCNESEKTITILNQKYNRIAKIKHNAATCDDIIFHPTRSNLLLTTHQNNKVLKLWNLNVANLDNFVKTEVKKNPEKKIFSFEVTSIMGELLLSDSILNNLGLMGYIGNEYKTKASTDSIKKRTDLLSHYSSLGGTPSYYLLDIKKVRNRKDSNLVDSLRLSFFSSSYTIPNKGFIKYITTNSSREYIMISTANGNNYIFSWGKDSIELASIFNSQERYGSNFKILENNDLITFNKTYFERKQTNRFTNNPDSTKINPPFRDTLEVWNLLTRNKLGEIYTTESDVRYLDFKEPYITWNGPQNKIVIVNLRTGEEVATFASKDGSWVQIESGLYVAGEMLIRTKDGYKFWNMTNNRLLMTIKALSPIRHYDSSPIIPYYPVPVLHHFGLYISPEEWLETEDDDAKRRWYYNYLQEHLEEILKTSGEDMRARYEEILKKLSKK